MGAMTALEFFGGGNPQSEVAFSANKTLDFRWRLWRLSTSTAGLTVSLPATSLPEFPIGIHGLIIINVGSVAFNVRDTELVLPSISVAANRAYVASSYVDNSGNARWTADPGRIWNP